MSEATSASNGEAYRVLARKYRPRSFEDLIGQEPMVRTLTNAFETGRIAQAWMLTGVRGVGKTTTARILARALNYETDAIHQPTIHMEEPGAHCQAIMEGRHVDVVEMDAASHTGIDDVREIIAQVRYRPVSARYKVYIIDEVHMLSTQAFNGLLKTLEEPPEHVKFVFATTEIRKVPITVLSRCQRFDLRRVDSATLMAHLRWIAGEEDVAIDDEALRLIARSAEGSVRDALSLMDQAIAHGAGTIAGQAVRGMLGLADRVRVIDLFENLMRGDAAAALKELREQYTAGADPAVVLTDLSDFTHLVTTLRYVPEASEDASLSPVEVERGLEFSKTLSIRTLDQVWQMLLASLEETRQSSAPRQSAEMALIRIAHAADLPSPDELLRLVKSGELGALPAPMSPSPSPSASRPASGGDGSAGGEAARHRASGSAPARQGDHVGSAQATSGADKPLSRAGGSPVKAAATGGGTMGAARGRLSLAQAEPNEDIRAEAGVAAPLDRPDDSDDDGGPGAIASLEDLAALAQEKRDSLMRVSIRRYLRLVKMEPGRLEVGLTPEAPKTLVGDLMRKMHQWTGVRWVVTVSNGAAGPSLDEAAAQKRSALLADAEKDPEVAAILAAFPGAKVSDVRLRGEAEDAAEKAELDADLDRDEASMRALEDGRPLGEEIPDDPAGYSFDPDRDEDTGLEDVPPLDPEDPGYLDDEL